MQSLGEAGWKNSQGIFVNKKKNPIIYLFILFLQAIGTTVKKKKQTERHNKYSWYKCWCSWKGRWWWEVGGDVAGSSPPPGWVRGQRQQVTDDKELSEKIKRAEAAGYRWQGSKWEIKCVSQKNSNKWCYHPRTDTEQKSAHGSNVIFSLWHWIS